MIARLYDKWTFSFVRSCQMPSKVALPFFIPTMNYNSSYFTPLPVFGVVSIWYFGLSILLQVGSGKPKYFNFEGT
jgi:hypothetical protein